MKKLRYPVILLLISQFFILSEVSSQTLTTWNYHYGSIIIKDAEYFRYMQEIAEQNYQFRKAKGEEKFALAIESYNGGDFKETLYHLKELHFIGLRPQVHKLRTYCYLQLGKCHAARKESKKIEKYDYKLWKQVTQEAKNNCK